MIRLSGSRAFGSYAYPGASCMRWYFVKPYVRMDPNSLLHYPEVSRIDGRKIDWMYGKPIDRSELVAIYGPNTIELRNLPMGRTPEYLQERLRRFFSKYGVVTFCRCQPHELDPYQCNGTGYVTFRSKKASIDAASANLVLPFTLHSKIISIRHLDTDKKNDPDYIFKQHHYNKQIISLCKALYEKIYKHGDCTIDNVSQGLYEHSFYTGRPLRAGISVLMRFGTWEDLLHSEPFNRMFQLKDGKITLLLTGSENMERIIKKAQIILDTIVNDSITQYWRQGKMKLIEQAQVHADALHHQRPLPEQLQLLSRSHTMYRLHDERLLFKMAIKKKRNDARRIRRLQAETARMNA